MCVGAGPTKTQQHASEIWNQQQARLQTQLQQILQSQNQMKAFMRHQQGLYTHMQSELTQANLDIQTVMSAADSKMADTFE